MMIRRLLPPSLLQHHLAWWCRHPTTIRLRSTSSCHSCFASSSFFSSPSVASSTAQKKETNLPPKVYDVIIIGGGPTGLFLSSLLSKYNISSQLVFDKRPIAEVIKHPQAHYINIRSMEILKAELPIVYDKVVNGSSRNTTSWEAFQFAGCVVTTGGNGGGGGTRLGKVIHPVRSPIKVGQRGDATNLYDDDVASLTASSPEKNRCWNPTATTMGVPDSDDDDDDDDVVMIEDDDDDASACKPAHLAQNKFVSLLLQEVMSKQQQQQQQQQTSQTKVIVKDDVGEEKCNDDKSHLHYGEEVIDIVPSSSSFKAGNHHHHDSNSNSNNNNNASPPIVTITTSSGAQYQTKYLFACDGAHSYTRTKFCSPTIHMIGDPGVQELINVHFRTNTALSSFLMMKQQQQHHDNDDNNQAMLHFIYNSQLVGCFVCHDGYEGEWVLQIPYFPPYQTLEVDFSTDKVRQMIWSGLLGVIPNQKKTEEDGSGNNNNTSLYDFEILSIRPWTMSCLVANQYYNQCNNIGLVGDAAHAFPPAGGFGMNTGLQDAHNLAWRVALSLKNSNRSHSQLTTIPSSFLVKYDNERRPIAQQNAALSVRNYKRTLQLARACYLDAQHPALLLQVLNSPPTNLLPMKVRQEMFRNLVTIAMMPLGSLLPSSSKDERSSSSTLSMPHSFHANHLRSNVQKILQSGGSLPLVFPRYEIGFSYESNMSKGITTMDEEDDTAGYNPRLRVGHRMPHVLVEVTTATFSPSNVDKRDELVVESISAVAEPATPSRIISLTDISSDLRQMNQMTTPLFTLLVIGSSGMTKCIIPHINSAVCRIMKQWNVPIILVTILPPNSNENNNDDNATAGRFLMNFATAIDSHETLFKLLRNEKKALLMLSSCGDNIILNNGHNNTSNTADSDSDNDKEVNALIMIRPDGHIANVTWMDEFTIMNSSSNETISNDLQNAIERGLENALCV